ncbi:LLM class flavin-dependent oxidoreductase [Actinoallomurus liliacearum]|uniref:LLM class flavin-dependent oxidoreductase n=2 Tax=Actinoallomurus liliacearum TaxID=1080073 RepID=A0ABP8TZ17_9ACTN
MVCGMTDIGVLLPTREAAIGGDWDVSRLIDFARRAEGLGFDSVWAGDSLTARPRVEPLTLLSAVAAATTTVGVGTAALTGALRQPLLAAHAITTLDLVSEGRLTLGLGAGFPYPQTAAEFTAAGVPFTERLGRLLETVRLWRSLWSADRPDSFDGRYWRFEGLAGLPAAARPGGPPLWLAGAGPKAVDRVGRLFDGWLPYLPDPVEYGRQRAEIDVVAAGAGREPAAVTPALYVTVLPQDDPERARAELDAYVRAYYGSSLDDMATLQAFIAGTPDQCAERLAAYADAGARHFVIRVGALDASPHLETVARIAEAVRAETRVVAGSVR